MLTLRIHPLHNNPALSPLTALGPPLAAGTSDRTARADGAVQPVSPALRSGLREVRRAGRTLLPSIAGGRWPRPYDPSSPRRVPAGSAVPPRYRAPRWLRRAR